MFTCQWAWSETGKHGVLMRAGTLTELRLVMREMVGCFCKFCLLMVKARSGKLSYLHN